jgi:gliding motility-associated-like protein
MATDLGGPTLYTVTVTDNNGCFSTALAQILEPSAVQAFINAPDTICYGEQLQLFANGGGGTQPYTSFDWTGGVTTTGQGPILDTLTVSTLYNVMVTDDNGCTAFATHTVTVRAQPAFTVADQTICQGELATLTPANLTGGNPSNPFTFIWGEVDNVTNPTSYTGLGTFNPYTASPADTTHYAVYVDNLCASSDTVYASINVNDTAIVRILSNTQIGCPILMVDFKADSLGGPGVNDGNSYLWDFGNGAVGAGDSTFFAYNTSGTYDVTLTVTTANNCVSTVVEPGWVTVHPVPFADFTTDPTPPIVTLLNPTIEFINQSTGNDFANDWTFGDGEISILSDPEHTYQDTGFYDVVLVVTNIQGCMDTATQTVRVKPDFFFAIPNTFTPDGDGINDIFIPGALELTGGTDRNYNFYIFDRWGELIYEAHQMSDGWDGTYKGKIVKNDTYVWRIEVTDMEGTIHKYTGHVNVLK